MERTSLEEMVEYVCIVKVDMKGFVVSETSGEKARSRPCISHSVGNRL